jgi:5'-phosphate synthase pdxT subunit
MARRASPRTRPGPGAEPEDAGAEPSKPASGAVRVGVLAVQGAVSEHLDALRRAAERRGVQVEAIAVRTPEDLASVHGLVLPGGESTTISRLLRSGGLQDDVVRRAEGGTLALFGTCAGLILLSRSAVSQVEDKDIRLLGLLDAEVDRNAFGRQRDSFESALEVEGVGTVPAVFIRAPVLTKVSSPTEVLARNKRGIVAVRKGRILGTAFHPELTDDTRLHEWFLELAGEAASQRA